MNNTTAIKLTSLSPAGSYTTNYRVPSNSLIEEGNTAHSAENGIRPSTQSRYVKTTRGEIFQVQDISSIKGRNRNVSIISESGSESTEDGRETTKMTQFVPVKSEDIPDDDMEYNSSDITQSTYNIYKKAQYPTSFTTNLASRYNVLLNCKTYCSNKLLQFKSSDTKTKCITILKLIVKMILLSAYPVACAFFPSLILFQFLLMSSPVLTALTVLSFMVGGLVLREILSKFMLAVRDTFESKLSNTVKKHWSTNDVDTKKDSNSSEIETDRSGIDKQVNKVTAKQVAYGLLLISYFTILMPLMNVMTSKSESTRILPGDISQYPAMRALLAFLRIYEKFIRVVVPLTAIAAVTVVVGFVAFDGAGILGLSNIMPWAITTLRIAINTLSGHIAWISAFFTDISTNIFQQLLNTLLVSDGTTVLALFVLLSLVASVILTRMIKALYRRWRFAQEQARKKVDITEQLNNEARTARSILQIDDEGSDIKQEEVKAESAIQQAEEDKRETEEAAARLKELQDAELKTS